MKVELKVCQFKAYDKNSTCLLPSIMTTEEIKIRVDSETAKAFNSVSATERQKLELLLNVRLKESLSQNDSLSKIMNEISQEAISKGLTPEILQSLLEDE